MKQQKTGEIDSNATRVARYNEQELSKIFEYKIHVDHDRETYMIISKEYIS